MEQFRRDSMSSSGDEELLDTLPATSRSRRSSVSSTGAAGGSTRGSTRGSVDVDVDVDASDGPVVLVTSTPGSENENDNNSVATKEDFPALDDASAGSRNSVEEHKEGGVTTVAVPPALPHPTGGAPELEEGKTGPPLPQSDVSEDDDDDDDDDEEDDEMDEGFDRVMSLGAAPVGAFKAPIMSKISFSAQPRKQLPMRTSLKVCVVMCGVCVCVCVTAVFVG